jgi:signal transduction histidine kinase
MSSNFRTGEPGVSVNQEMSGAVAHALHQTTQPLTVLQGLLELALLKTNTVDEYKRVLSRSLQELRRVTDCFEHLRAITQLQQPPQKTEAAHV